MSRPRIVIVGAGFAGYRAARTLSRLTRHRADITLLNPTDYFLYLPLLPQVAAGILEPRRVTVSLSGTLPDVRLVLGEADSIDLDGHTVHYTGPEGDGGTLPFDRLILAAGSVNKLLPIPGVAEHAHGFRGLPEALYLRDHVTRQMELAASADDPENCSARCTFVVVGAGYTGTEVAAQGKLFTDSQVRKHPLRAGMRPRWLLLDIAERVLPELDERLSRTADRVLRQRGVEVRMGTSVKEATHRGVVLTDGEFVDTRTLVWCVGVRPDPLAESLGLPLERGRLLVDPYLQVPGRSELFAAGDGAAVPDLEKPGQYTPMTAQHAWRQGKAVARNVAASLGIGERRPYRHRDMGFVVDLGGVKAAANPLGVPLSGVAAGAVTRGYHLAAMPGNRIRVAADWLLDAVLPRQAVQLGLVRSWSVPLDTASPELARVPGGPEKGAVTSGERPRERGPEKGAERRSQAGAGGSTEPSGTEETDRSRPVGETARNQPGEPARNQPYGEPAKNQAGGRPAKGTGSGTGDHPDATEAQDSKRFGAPASVRRVGAVKGGGSSGRRGGPSRSGGRTDTGTSRGAEPPDPVQDPDAARHPEPPGPVTRSDLRAAQEPPADAPAVHKPHPEDPAAHQPRSTTPGRHSRHPSEGAS